MTFTIEDIKKEPHKYFMVIRAIDTGSVHMHIPITDLDQILERIGDSAEDRSIDEISITEVVQQTIAPLQEQLSLERRRREFLEKEFVGDSFSQVEHEELADVKARLAEFE